MIDKKNIEAGEEIHSDKGYKLGTEEEQRAFAKKRQEAALDEMVVSAKRWVCMMMSLKKFTNTMKRLKRSNLDRHIKNESRIT